MKDFVFSKFFDFVIDLEFCVGIMPETSAEKNFTRTRQEAFLCLLLNHGNIFIFFDRELFANSKIFI